MRFKAILYEKFYDRLLEKFSSKFLNQTDLELLGDKYYRNWWAEKEGARGKYHFIDVFGDYTTDQDYFYKKKSQYNPEKVNEAYVKDAILVKALNFMGFALPSSLDNISLSKYEEARVLFQLFLERHDRTFLDNNSEYVVFNSKDTRLSRLKSINGSTTKFLIQNDPELYIVEKIVSNYKTKISNFVSQYFELLSTKDFKAALSFWEKGAHQNNPLVLGTLYYNAHLHDLKIVDIEIQLKKSKSLSSAECTICFIQNVEAYTSDDYEILQDLRISDIDRFVKKLAAIKRSAEKNSFTSFDRIKIKDLFNYRMMDELQFIAGVDQARLNCVFPETKRYKIYKYEKVYIKEDNGNLIIDGIADIYTNTAYKRF